MEQPASPPGYPPQGGDRPALGMLLAVSAGALVYVGASHLLPAVEKDNKKYTLVSLAAGIFIAILIVTAKG
jgi:zinc and cadmium transporter